MTDKRTLKQNRYRWGVVVDTVLQEINKQLEKDNCEYRATPKDIDIFIKDKALGLVHKVNTSLGEITITGKLRTRSTKDFEEAMLQIRAHFDNKGIYIPAPNEPME